MYTDPIRQVADWLGHASLGVNALLPSVPKDVADAALPLVTIAAATDHDWVQRGVIDRAKLGNGPLLLVGAFPGAEASFIKDGTEYPDTANLAIAVRYAARGTDTSAIARQGWQTLRAAMRSLVLQGKGSAIVRRNQVAIGPVNGLIHITAFEKAEDDYLVDVLTVTLSVDDAWAGGATAP